MAELNYAFRKRLLQVHEKNRRIEKSLKSNQVEITSDWQIVVPCNNDFLLMCARDLEDYFFVSMKVEVKVVTARTSEKAIIYSVDNSLKENGSYSIEITEYSVSITGKDERAAAQAGYFIEDLMNLEEAPYLEIQDMTRSPRFTTRMVHSGYSIDSFPNEHLNSIAHLGINAILLFVKGVNMTTCGYVDFNELIFRAARYGIDVYAYSYMKNDFHPSDHGAKEFYDGVYGKLFKECPGLKGIVFVGESIEFPSHDIRTTGRPWRENRDENGNIISNKPSPGWFPCNDFPEWVTMVKDVVREQNPNADVVFWTYNWGYVDKDLRVELINNLPTDISLQATFEMFEEVERMGGKSTTTDYTIFEPGPGEYFLSEAEAAKKRGIPLYSMTNSGGLTWDIGTIPYEPVPYQWLKRYNKMIEMNEKYSLCGSMDSHHFGIYPSFISELAKWCFWKPSPDGEKVIEMLAGRDWGSENTKNVTDAYKMFSDGINLLVSTNEDQYGPLRIGPSYPLTLFDDADIQIPSVPYAHFGGNAICNPNYMYKLNTPFQKEKFDHEIMLYSKSADYFMNGSKILFSLIPTLSLSKKDNAQRIAGLGKFMGHAILTARNTKEWHKRKMSLIDNNGKFPQTLAEMKEIALSEIQNARDALPLVEFDSRLGYEPSMEYICDAAHIEWKISVVERMINDEMPKLLKDGYVKNPPEEISIFAGGRSDTDESKA